MFHTLPDACLHTVDKLLQRSHWLAHPGYWQNRPQNAPQGDQPSSWDFLGPDNCSRLYAVALSLLGGAVLNLARISLDYRHQRSRQQEDSHGDGQDYEICGLGGLGKQGGKLHRLRMIAFYFKQPGAPPQHAVEPIHEQIDRLVAVVRGDAAIHVGTMNDDVPFGDKRAGDVVLPVILQLNLDPNDPFLVAHQPSNLVVHVEFERGGQVEMDAGDDHLAIMGCAVHDCGFLLG